MTRKDRGNRKGRRGANYLNRHLKPHQPKDVVSFASELEESTLEQAQQNCRLSIHMLRSCPTPTPG